MEVGESTHQTASVWYTPHNHPVFAFPSPHLLSILGYLWLHRHSPDNDWANGAICAWGTSGQRVCLIPHPHHLYGSQAMHVQPSQGCPANTMTSISTAKATSLPTYRPHDCTTAKIFHAPIEGSASDHTPIQSGVFSLCWRWMLCM